MHMGTHGYLPNQQYIVPYTADPNMC
jgi:hypothetical protein